MKVPTAEGQLSLWKPGQVTGMLPRLGGKIHPEQKNGRWKTLGLLSEINKRCCFTSWVKENIRKKECCHYVEDGREGICVCGYPKINHADHAIKPEEFCGEEWNVQRHTKDFPTDAFGYMSFGLGQKVGKYIRVSNDTTAEVVYELMTEQWRLLPPNLLISVTGGAKNFYMKPKLKMLFHRGIIKVAQTTGAWILTGGTHAGVMKYVGKAVRDYTLSRSSSKTQVVAIGVATWGIVHNRGSLVDPEGCFPAHYSLDEQGQGRLSSLDVNHTHFVLVDDGTHGNYGREIELRSRLEKFISDQPIGNGERGLTIPVVLVVVEGGPGTLNTIYSAIMNGTPCVVLGGSGRLADVIAQVQELPTSHVTIALVRRLLQKFFRQEFTTFCDSTIFEWTKKLQDIIRNSHLLTVFQFDNAGHGDVDVAILQALLKASQNRDSPQWGNWERQLELAVAWNRVDIAENEIFIEENKLKSSDLYPAMFSALVGHKPDFVRLLLENGVHLRDFLNEETLCKLYAQLLPGCLFMRKLAKHMKRKNTDYSTTLAEQRNVLLSDVAVVLRHFLGNFTQPLYQPPPTENHMTRDDTTVTFTHKGSSTTENEANVEQPRETNVPRDPGRDLFIWAIVQNNKKLAEIAWEECSDSITAALAASKILKKLAQEEDDEGNEVEEMRELADLYEKQAMGVFIECYNQDEQRAKKLLLRVSPSWGRTSCLRLALEADDKSFVAHPGVQALLTQIWCGELAIDNSQWKILLCMCFIPLIYTGLVSFRCDEKIQKEAERLEEMNNVECVRGTLPDVRLKYNISEGSNLKHLNCINRLVSFFTSPLVKFYWNIIMYFCFLALFAVVLMIDFQTVPSWTELLLYVWVASLVCEELRQLFDDPDGYGFKRKSKTYIQDIWNILDVLSIVLFIIGLVLRLTTATFYAGKVILCIDFIVFCLRLMAIFTISRTLGPKIIIVRRMMTDMFFFLFLLSIWVVAYGVAKQGILIDNEKRLDWIMRGALYEPYLTIFGTMPSSIDRTAFNIDACSVNGSDPMKPKCPVLNENMVPVFPDWLTIILLCVYLLFANILLLNLLIAIFNYTFSEVQENTDCIWRFQRYDLIKEYYSRPPAPPPFILLCHLYLFIKHVLLCWPCKKAKHFKKDLSDIEEEEMLSWESVMKANYLDKLHQEQSQSMEERIQGTADKVDAIVELVEEREQYCDAVMRKLVYMEEQVLQSAKALQWIINAFKSQGTPLPECPPELGLLGRTEQDESGDESVTEEPQFHIHSRQFQYPEPSVIRFPVPDEKVLWKVEFTQYKPKIYNKGDTRSEQQINESQNAEFDKFRNPHGRTGLRGRGCLHHLGPNMLHHVVITRWHDSGNTILEFLAVWNEADGLWTLPGGCVTLEKDLPEELMKYLGAAVCENIRALFLEGPCEKTGLSQVYRSYVDDHRNTDNAWVERAAFNIHLDRGSTLIDKLNDVVEETRRQSKTPLQWKAVSSKEMFCAYQKEVLSIVSRLHSTKHNADTQS